MKLVSHIRDIPKITPPICLTIGMFDGVHLGHRHLIETLKTYGKPVVVTFANHPRTLFNPSQPLQLLSTPEEKVKKLKALGVELTLMLDFNQQLAATSYQTFLTKIFEKLPFETLIVGRGTALGKNREGNMERCNELGKKLGFKALELPKYEFDGAPISSGRIRKLLASDQTDLANKYLGW